MRTERSLRLRTDAARSRELDRARAELRSAPILTISSRLHVLIVQAEGKRVSWPDIQAHFCLNLRAAVNVVLAHRLISRQLAGREPLLPLNEMLHEVRGAVPTPAMDAVGWNGK